MREKLIELLSYFGDCYVVDYRHIVCDTRICEIADYLIANGVTLDNQVSSSKWIPVTERLPEISALDKEWSKTVLFRTTLGYIFSGYRCVGRPQKSFYDDDWTPPYWLNESEELEFEDDEVTHWMPLPQPPKGE